MNLELMIVGNGWCLYSIGEAFETLVAMYFDTCEAQWKFVDHLQGFPSPHFTASSRLEEWCERLVAATCGLVVRWMGGVYESLDSDAVELPYMDVTS